MVALKVSLPHLSLSRNNSPSRPSTPAQRSSNGSSRPSSVEIALPDGGAAAADGSTLDKEARARRASLGALGAALRRSTSGKVHTISSLGASTPLNSNSRGPTPPTSRPTSDNASTGLLPLRNVLNAATHSKQRAHSSDRRPLPTAALPSLATTTGALQHSVSQPPLSRKKDGGKRSPVLGPASGSATPTSHGAGGRGPALHNLEESYVGKVSLRLGEAVNKVFLAGGPGELSWKGRSAPKVDKAKEVGEIVIHELQAALHDVYLLRTLLRSSVLKALSLFLTRLTAALLPSDSVGPPPLTAKEADSLATPLRFNLQIVRCAYAVKNALALAARGAPPFVRDTLRPWSDKLNEVMARVMNPLITSVRISVSLICAKARVAETSAEAAVSAAVGVPTVAGTSTAALKQGSSQLRSLSMGRAHTPTPAAPVNAQGPLWLRELSAVLDATVKMVSRLECGADADKWLVSVGTHAVWKGMLSLSARRLIDDDLAGAPLSSAPSGTATPTLPTTKSGLFTKSVKRSPSPGDSPPLHPIGHVSSSHHPGAGPSPSHLAFIRLLCELELLESRLVTYINSLSSALVVDPHMLMSGTCADVAKCGLCKTGRTFDAESSDDEDDSEPVGGLAQYAMREAMQALSAMVVVVRASKKAPVLREALLLDGIDEEGHATAEEKGMIEKKDQEIVPLTPMALMSGPAPSLPPTPPSSTPSTIALPPTAVNATPLHVCPTLAHAIDTLPTLILLHLLASRVPHFQLPHELWGIDWRGYEKEIRTFAAGEEWVAEVGWEMAGEVARCVEAREMKDEKEKMRLEVLAVAIRRKAGVDVPGVVV